MLIPYRWMRNSVAGQMDCLDTLFQSGQGVLGVASSGLAGIIGGEDHRTDCRGVQKVICPRWKGPTGAVQRP